jgi:transitional endoplasmic reticulum ATPase
MRASTAWAIGASAAVTAAVAVALVMRQPDELALVTGAVLADDADLQKQRPVAQARVNAVAGIFKQEMNDLIEANPNVIVVATTNFPHRVDDSLIRSGRFDVKISVPKPDEASRAEIFRKMIQGLAAAHERDGFRMFAEDLDLGALGVASTGMTGADIKEVLRRVQMTKAMQEARSGAAEPISQPELLSAIRDLRGHV